MTTSQNSHLLRSGSFALNLSLLLLVLVVLPNLAFWLAGREIFLSRSLINLDYLLLGALCLWLPLALRVMAMASLLILDFLTAIGPAYHFSFASMLDSALNAFEMQGDFAWPITLIILFVGLTCGGLLSFVIRPHSGRGLTTLALVVLAVGLQWCDSRMSARMLAVNLTTSTLGNIARVLTAGARLDAATQLSSRPAEQPAASDILRGGNGLSDELPIKVWLIIAESWGVYREESINDYLASQIRLAETAYTLRSGKVPFKGSTVPGELRELCRLNLVGVHPPAETLGRETCLPELFAAKGYKTLAIHGYSGSLFRRNKWYPALDFEQVWFGDDLDDELSERSRCGVSFRGVCDADILEWLMQISVENEDDANKQFAYFLTLNSHLPVYSPGPSFKEVCKRFETTAASRSQCDLLRHHILFFRKLSDVVKHMVVKPLVVIVGDHMPPFLEVSERSRYDESHVPFIAIDPRP